MIDREDLGSWLSGPRPADDDNDWPGKRLGLPESGAGSVAPFWRRLLGLCLDWLMCLFIAQMFFDGQAFAILGIFAAEYFLLVSTLGYTVGHRVFGIEVRAVTGSAPGPVKGLIRTVLLVLVIPAAIVNGDQRGVHDVASGTVVRRRVPR